MKTLQKTFYSGQYDDIEDICTIEVTAEDFLKRANERLECQTLEDIDAETEDLVWDELYNEREKDFLASQEDVEQWEADMECEPA